MRILSLFDGMACGAIAFTLAGIPIDEYHAYEIDKFAIQAATHNFPFIEEHGDVFQADFTQYEEFDYLIGGSPCTYWSIAQSPDKRETVASGMGWDLFSQYTRALKEAKPKYFIYENNKSMAKPIYDAISDAFGFEPIMINSALVSAQNRERYYWVGKRNEYGDYDKVQIEQPKDRGIMLKDILINPWEDVQSKDKGYTLTAHYPGAELKNTIERSQRDMVAKPIRLYTMSQCQGDRIYSGEGKAICQSANGGNFGGCTGSYAFKVMNYDLESVNNTDSGVQAMLDMPGTHNCNRRILNKSGKSTTITAGGGGNHEPKVFEKVSEYQGKTYEVKDGQIEVKGKKYPVKLSDGLYVVQKLSVDECKRLQTVPDWYDMTCISNSQAYKCLGNGWTCEVIVHLIKATQEGKTEAKQLTFWEV